MLFSVIGTKIKALAIKYIDKNKFIKQHVHLCPNICQRLNPLFFGLTFSFLNLLHLSSSDNTFIEERLEYL